MDQRKGATETNVAAGSKGKTVPNSLHICGRLFGTHRIQVK